MPLKNAVIVSVGLVVAAFLFAWVYLNYVPADLQIGDGMSVKSKSSEAAPKPVTTDTAVNDLIDEAVADRDDLALEEAAELSDLESGNALVNDLSNVYDENE
jgi:hypothetical protein